MNKKTLVFNLAAQTLTRYSDKKAKVKKQRMEETFKCLALRVELRLGTFLGKALL